jgi:uncharacterized membrane protein
MPASRENKLFWMLIIGASFLLAVGIAAMPAPAVANNVPILNAWRVIMGMLAIVFIKRLADALPRIRVISLRNLS